MNKQKKKNRKRLWGLCIVMAIALCLNASFVYHAYATEYKACIGDQYYQTLTEAAEAVTEGQTIRLLSPVDLGEAGESGVVDKPGISFALDLGGYSVTGSNPSALIQVSGGNLTVYNGQITNQMEGGSAIAAIDPNDSSISFPVGFVSPDPMTAQVAIPAAYHLNIAAGDNGVVRYGSSDGTDISLMGNVLFVGGDIVHSFYFVADIGYEVDAVMLDGETQNVTDHIDLTQLSKDSDLSVTFQKITFTITPLAYANNKTAKLGVTLSPASAVVEYGGSQTFSFTVRNGFRLLDVLVNNVSIGPVTTIELTQVTAAQEVKIILEKNALFIMLDAGHYAYYNHSPVLSSYYEGNTMWVYHKYLEQNLEQYPGIIVDTTRPDNSKAIGSALGPWDRGAMGEGYDLVLSVHSNACSSPSADHPVAIYTLNPNYTTVSKTLGLKLATKVAEIMKTNEAAQVYGKTQSDGQDWYGVNRGAASVGVPSIILEHSFHTNYRATVWLSSDANLRALAVAEAKVIADYYGIAPPAAIAPPAVPTHFGVLSRTYNSLLIRWDHSPNATGYEIYRSTSPTTGFVRLTSTAYNSCINPGLLTGKAYYYKVRAYRTVDSRTVYSGFTAVVGAKPVPQTPSMTVIAGIDKATVSWTQVPGAYGYQVYRAYGTSGSYYLVKTIYSGYTLKWTNYGRPTGKIYTYKVRAYRTVNGVKVVGAFSVPRSVKIK